MRYQTAEKHLRILWILAINAVELYVAIDSEKVLVQKISLNNIIASHIKTIVIAMTTPTVTKLVLSRVQLNFAYEYQEISKPQKTVLPCLMDDERFDEIDMYAATDVDLHLGQNLCSEISKMRVDATKMNDVRLLQMRCVSIQRMQKIQKKQQDWLIMFLPVQQGKTEVNSNVAPDAIRMNELK